MVTLATLAATVLLYIVMPKGFLPLQDTGLITAVTEAGADVSFIEMQRAAAQVEDAMRGRPDVAGVVSVVGVIAAQCHAECRPAHHHAGPRDDRASGSPPIIDTAEARGRRACPA